MARFGRFLLLLVTRRWGWTLIAILIISGGVLWGMESHVPYLTFQTAQNSSYYFTTNAKGDIYIFPLDHSTYFLARHDGFNSPLDLFSISLDNSISVTASPESINVNDTLMTGEHISQAHLVEELDICDQNSHCVPAYTTADFTANPDGFFENHWWPGGVTTIFVGLLIASVALFVRRRKVRPVVSTATVDSAPSPAASGTSISTSFRRRSIWPCGHMNRENARFCNVCGSVAP